MTARKIKTAWISQGLVELDLGGRRTWRRAGKSVMAVMSTLLPRRQIGAVFYRRRAHDSCVTSVGELTAPDSARLRLEQGQLPRRGLARHDRPAGSDSRR